MLCNALGNQPPLYACHNTHSKPIRDVKHKAANVANNRTKANRGHRAAAVVPPTMEVEKADSTEATTPITGLTLAAHSKAAVAVTPPKAPQTLHPIQEIQQLELLQYP
jgi:hypothetical protein